MRLFIAIKLPGEARDYLFTIKNNFSRDLAKVKWVGKKQIHLTLKFLGEVDEKIIKEIISKLKEVEFKEFELELDDLGFFPNEDYIKVLWVGVKNFNKIIELHDDIDEKLSKYFTKDREFSCHITLGRIKFVKDKKYFLDIIKKTKIEKLKFSVKSFSLIKSELSKDGSKYIDIENFYNKTKNILI